jgi:dGTPase
VLDRPFADDWHVAADDAARRRVVIDQVASLTDARALSWHARLV